MPHDLGLKDRLVLAGLTVTEIDGWQTRGSDTFRPSGSVHHHTAGPRSGVQPSLGVVINGRSDLPGPLCNVHGPREESLRVNLVAAGRANHAGLGGYHGLTGNSSVWGLEEEHCGYPDESISPLRVDRMARVHAAFLFGTAEASMVCQHYEWAPTRKIDFCHPLLDPNNFRFLVGRRLTLMSTAPPPVQTPTLIEDIMLINDPSNGHTYILGPASNFTGAPPGSVPNGRMVFTGLSNHPNGVNVTQAGMKSLISAYGQPIYTP